MLTWKWNTQPWSMAFAVSVFSFISLFPLAERATAGQGASAPAGVIGQVADGTGSVLPGVTVTAVSPALQVPSVVAVTDGRGEYRLTPLPIGTYTVTYELPGFQSLRRENVRLTVGFVAKLDQVLVLGSVAETITVSGASPIVDVTSTAARTDLSIESLTLLPTTRDGLKGMIGLVPGVVTNLQVGQSALTDTVQFKVNGQLGETWHMFEGVLMASPTTSGSNGAHLDFNGLEATRVQTVGSNAEMPRRGILIDGILKSGGNEFHGAAVFYGSSGRFESKNVDKGLSDLGVLGLPKLGKLWDYSGTFGGRIVRNKLWFFVAGRLSGYDRDVLDAFYADGKPIQLNTKLNYRDEKISYQMTPGNKLIFLDHQSWDYQLRNASRFVPASSREQSEAPVDIRKVEWQTVRGSSLVASLQQGYWFYNSAQFACCPDGAPPHQVATTDNVTGYVTGDTLRDDAGLVILNHHSKGVVNWYRPGLLSGNHGFKVGFDHVFSQYARNFNSRAAGNYQLVYSNGTPFRINTWNYPSLPTNNRKVLGIYAQDAWTIGRRMTLDLGIRYGYENAYAPPQCRPAGEFAAAECYELIQLKVWHSAQPRLHVAYDVFGDATTVLKGGWGRFGFSRPIANDLTTANRYNETTTAWTWRDLNGDRLYQPGEVNLNPNGLDFQGISGVTNAVVNPNQKQPMSDEFSVMLERQLMANLGVRLTGIYSRNFNMARLLDVSRPYSAYNIPITRPDPGPDGLAGTSDDPGKTLTYWEYPRTLAGLANSATMLVNDPNGDQSFKTIEIAVSKRVSQGAQLTASYSATKLDFPFGTGANPALNPNAEINTAIRTWEWEYKAAGSYTFPYEILASANFERRFGAPQARTVRLTGGSTISNLTVNAEPIGSIKLPVTNMLDARIAKRFRLGGSRSFEVRADIFNVFNINTTILRVLQSGPAYLVPLAGGASSGNPIVLPRILQFGAQFAF